MGNVSISTEKKTSIFKTLKGGLIVSCQAPNGTPIDTPAFIAAQAQTVLEAGAVGIRAQGVENVAAISKVTDVPIIGLVKRYLDDTPVYITPTVKDVLDLERAGASIIAIDATERLRSGGVDLASFFKEIRKQTEVPILADVDTLNAGLLAENIGCDAVATTLSGYTESSTEKLPDIDLVSKLVSNLKIPVMAEGGFHLPSQVTAAYRAGAWSVCIGTAITNPFLLTKTFLDAIP